MHITLKKKKFDECYKMVCKTSPKKKKLFAIAIYFCRFASVRVEKICPINTMLYGMQSIKISML